MNALRLAFFDAFTMFAIAAQTLGEAAEGSPPESPGGPSVPHTRRLLVLMSNCQHVRSSLLPALADKCALGLSIDRLILPPSLASVVCQPAATSKHGGTGAQDALCVCNAALQSPRKACMCQELCVGSRHQRAGGLSSICVGAPVVPERVMTQCMLSRGAVAAAAEC